MPPFCSHENTRSTYDLSAPMYMYNVGYALIAGRVGAWFGFPLFPVDASGVQRRGTMAVGDRRGGGRVVVGMWSVDEKERERGRGRNCGGQTTMIME